MLTQSIQSLFGAKVAHRDLGFVYNNYLCTCPRYPHPYALGPRCRPRSNAAPTLVLPADRGTDRQLLALGAAGSRRIISALLQVISGVVDRGLDIAEAVSAPRVHGLVGRKVWIERPAASGALLARLRARRREPIIKSRLNFAMGSVQALQFLPDASVRGAADPRRDGNVGVLH
jgi:gamma-glutamyltranspeptidase/glutathione hydrolase